MNRKTNNIIFWIATIFIVISEGIIPALTFRTQLARDGISHLGYPDYFGVMIVGFRILGVLVLILPQVSTRIKEWAYAGFAIEFISASISYIAVDGLTFYCIIPLISMSILIVSYFTFHKNQKFDHVIPGIS
jgi:hypothetical protein